MNNNKDKIVTPVATKPQFNSRFAPSGNQFNNSASRTAGERFGGSASGSRFAGNYNKDKRFGNQYEVSALPTYTVLRRFVCKTNHGGVQRRTNIITAVGDAKLHKVGIGAGKAATYQVAAKQAEVNANNNLRFVKVLTLKNNTVKTIEQATIFEGYGLKLIIKPVMKPNVICANRAIRAICQLVGLNAISVKVIGKSAAIQNQIYAFIDAITTIESPRDVAKRLSIPIGDILKRNKIYGSVK